MRTRVLVIGLGQIGMGYDLRLDPATHVYTHARAFSMHGSFVLAGGVDTDGDRRRLFETTFDKPSFEEPIRAMIAAQPDLVVVAGPTSTHEPLIRAILAHASPRAILCEKPLAHDLHEARDIVRRCADRTVQLFVNYMRRADPGAIEIQQRLSDRRIATPVKGVCWYSKGFVHNGSHFFNLIEHWLGPMQRFTISDRGRDWNGEEPEPDVRVEFQNGVVEFIAAREEDFSHYTIELVSPSGRLRYEQGGRVIEWRPVVADPFIPGYRVLDATPELISAGRDRSQWHVAEQLAAAMAGKPFHLCTGAEGLATLESMTMINNAR
jgi:predicted dehydrogenase